MEIETPQTSIEVTAPSVDEAIILGLTRLELTRDDVEITVLEEASKGFLGIGSRLARVRLIQCVPEQPSKAPPAPPTPPPPVLDEPPSEAVATDAPPEKTPIVVEPVTKSITATVKMTDVGEKETVATVKEQPPATVSNLPAAEKLSANNKLDRDLLESVALDVAAHLFPDLSLKISTHWEREDRPSLWIALQGADADMLVGPRAHTLNSVQYLFRTLIHHKVDGNYNIVVDAAGYRKRRRNSLESLAHKKAEQAINTHRTIRLRPMPASERRLIHILLRKDARVKTESVGYGTSRAVTVIPVNKKSR